MVLNHELYSAVSDMVNAAVNKLGEVLFPLLFRPDSEEQFDRQVAHLDALKQLPEFIKCKTYLQNIRSVDECLPILNQLLPTHGERILLEDLLSLFVSQYLLINKTRFFDLARFGHLYEKIEQLIFTGKLSCKAVAPVAHFFPERDFEIAEDIKVRRIMDADKKLFSSIRFELLRLVYCSYLIEITFETESTGVIDLEDLYKKARSKIYRVLSCLRLYKEGTTGTVLMFVFPDVIYPARSTIAETIPFDPSTTMNYHLSRDHIESFKEFYVDLSSKSANLDGNKERIINLAIKRFNNSYERADHEDRLIDLIIGFEALLLPEKDELGLRLALRTAVMLEQDAGKRQDIYLNVKAAYRLRSDIVHGESVGRSIKVGTSNIVLENFVDKIQRYASRSILAMLDALQTQSREKIVEDLDDRWFAR